MFEKSAIDDLTTLFPHFHRFNQLIVTFVPVEGCCDGQQRAFDVS